MLFPWQHKHFVAAILPWGDFTDGCSPVWVRNHAITAAAHKLARIFYRLWTSGVAYTDPGIDAYEQKYHERMVNNLKKKARALGFDLIPQPTLIIINKALNMNSPTQRKNSSVEKFL